MGKHDSSYPFIIIIMIKIYRINHNNVKKISCYKDFIYFLIMKKINI